MAKQLLTRATPAFANPFREMDEMQHRLRRFFQPTGDLLAPESVVGWMPPVEIAEKPDALILTAELPGLTREQIDVTFEDDVLTIRGEKSEKKEEKDDTRYHLVERSYGTFARSFVMPRTIDATKITADFRDGVLVVRVPKVEPAQTKGRKIEVNAK